MIEGGRQPSKLRSATVFMCKEFWSIIGRSISNALTILIVLYAVFLFTSGYVTTDAIHQTTSEGVALARAAVQTAQLAVLEFRAWGKDLLANTRADETFLTRLTKLLRGE
jgi:hypothetical protein